MEGYCLVAIDNSRDLDYIRHCWNILETDEENIDLNNLDKYAYFDATAEYCFAKQPDEIRYYPVAICSSADYENLNGTDIFVSNAPQIVEQLKARFRDL